MNPSPIKCPTCNSVAWLVTQTSTVTELNTYDTEFMTLDNEDYDAELLNLAISCADCEDPIAQDTHPDLWTTLYNLITTAAWDER